jgi:hypothetical protein
MSNQVNKKRMGYYPINTGVNMVPPYAQQLPYITPPYIPPFPVIKRHRDCNDHDRRGPTGPAGPAGPAGPSGRITDISLKYNNPTANVSTLPSVVTFSSLIYNSGFSTTNPTTTFTIPQTGKYLITSTIGGNTQKDLTNNSNPYTITQTINGVVNASNTIIIPAYATPLPYSLTATTISNLVQGNTFSVNVSVSDSDATTNINNGTISIQLLA